MQMHNFVLTREVIVNSMFPVDRMRELNFHRETAVRAHISAIKCRFPFFRTANNSMAGFAVYFHRWLSCCFSECSTVPRSQGNSISAQVCSFIRDFGSSSPPRLVINLFISIESSSSWVIIFFLNSKLYSQKLSCRISNLHLWAAEMRKCRNVETVQLTVL